MKSKYRKFNIYINLKNDHKARMHALVQKEVSLREDRPLINRCYALMKIKRYNINKAMKRLQMFKLRNIEIDHTVERMITEQYNIISDVKNEV